MAVAAAVQTPKPRAPRKPLTPKIAATRILGILNKLTPSDVDSVLSAVQSVRKLG